MVANAHALYSALALDMAIGLGIKDAPSTSDPNMYSTYAPLLLEVSRQFCHDESVNKIMGAICGSNLGIVP